ncbi:hypothetical protein ULF88_00825 [Halopseudomonas pachastrellae]|nr:hypothetical protein [Halopseudomonas pachastrellae]
MRTFAAATLLLSCLMPAAAQAFPIDLQSQFDGVTVEAETTDMSNIATVLLRTPAIPLRCARRPSSTAWSGLRRGGSSWLPVRARRSVSHSCAPSPVCVSR